MTLNRMGARFLYGAIVCTFGLVAMAGPVWSADSPKQSTGTGVTQGEDGSMSTKQGGNTGPTTGRNDQSGSGTGAVRDPSQAEPPRDKNRGSSQMDSSSKQADSQAKGQKQSDGRKDK